MVILKRLIEFLVSTDLIWFLLKPFARLGSMMLRIRNEHEQSRRQLEEEKFSDSLLDDIFQGRKVLHGPFEGLRYPAYNAIGSALYPKLLGSYERELHGVLEKLKSFDFTEIINIGCGEGYYAIGLARNFPGARVLACDTDPHALKLCREMAVLNNVSGQIEYASAFAPADLKKFRFSGTGLIVCDCEGYEKILFNSSTLENLRNCHLLVEVHDFIDIHISTILTKRFESGYTLTTIKSLDDIEKAKTYQYDELKGLDLSLKKKLLGEGRPAIMEWFYLAPNSR